MSKQINKSTIYLAGGLFGAMLGVAAAYLIDKSSENEGEENLFSSKNISKVGLGTISFLYTLIGKGKGRSKRRLS